MDAIRVAIEASGFKTCNTPEGFAAQCPTESHNHNKQKLSLNVAEKGDNILMHCKSRGCDRFDIVKAVGLPVSILFPTDEGFDRKAHKKKKSQRQIEKECEHAYLIIAQLPTMKADGVEPRAEDVISIQQSMAALKRHSFGEDEYFAIEEREQARVDLLNSAYVSGSGKVFYD
jgi:hypothetical protein